MAIRGGGGRQRERRGGDWCDIKFGNLNIILLEEPSKDATLMNSNIKGTKLTSQ